VAREKGMTKLDGKALILFIKIKLKLPHNISYSFKPEVKAIG